LRLNASSATISAADDAEVVRFSGYPQIHRIHKEKEKKKQKKKEKTLRLVLALIL